MRHTRPNLVSVARGGTWLLALTVAAAQTITLRAAEVPVPPRRHAEHLIFNETTNQWEQRVEPSPGTEDGDLDIARQWLALGEYKTVCKITKEWIKTYGKEAPRYPEALYLRGTAYLERGLYREAHKAYQELLNDYPGSQYAEAALSAEFRVAEQYMAGKRKRIWGGLLWFKDREGGVEIMDDIVANYSDTPLAEMAQMAKAEYYFARGDLDLAESEYATFARDFPRSRWHERALLMSARCAQGRFPGIKFDEAPLVEAEERYRQYQKAYPARAEQRGVPTFLDQLAATRADKTLDIGKFYEKTAKFQAARFYYRETVARWPQTPAALEARRRLTQIGEPLEEAPTTEPQASARAPRQEDPR
jgi:outer membrane protein assembly factor BamD (BamD/ComL family)